MDVGAIEPLDSSDPAEQAALWDARLRSPSCTAEQRAAFAGWLEADPANKAAYTRFEARLAALGEASDTDLRLQKYRREAQRFVRRRRARRALAAGIALAVLGVGLGGYVLLRSGIGDDVEVAASQFAPPALLETGPGERRVATLSDGTKVTLDTRTRLRVAFTSTERRVQLLSGQVLFDVAHDAQHPFSVSAGSRRFTAVGTAFEVRLDPAQVKITMVAGKVAVERVDAAVGPQRRYIVAGDQLTAAGGAPDRVERVDVERATSWSEGRIVFSDAPLAEVVAEINRYSARPVSIGDPALAEMRVGGMFKTDDPDGFVTALTNFLPIEARADDGRTMLVRRTRQ